MTKQTKEKAIVSILLILFMLAGLIGVLMINKYFIEQPAPLQQPVATCSMADDLFTEKESSFITKKYATITMYSAVETCDPQNCINARGTNPRVNYSVACPREIPFGTKVIIQGREYTCDDRTHVRFNGRFDIFAGYTQEDYETAIKFGKQKLEIIIIK